MAESFDPLGMDIYYRSPSDSVLPRGLNAEHLINISQTFSNTLEKHKFTAINCDQDASGFIVQPSNVKTIDAQTLPGKQRSTKLDISQEMQGKIAEQELFEDILNMDEGKHALTRKKQDLHKMTESSYESDHADRGIEWATPKSVSHSGPNIKHTLGLTEKFTDASEMDMLATSKTDHRTADIEELSLTEKSSNTQVLLDKEVTLPELLDTVLEMEEDYPGNKAEQDIADDLCVDLGAGGLVHLMEDNLKSQVPRQSKTFVKEYTGTFGHNADTVSLKQVSLKQGGKKAVVPRKNDNNQIIRAPVAIIQPKESVFFEGFSLNEYLENCFALYGKKLKSTLPLANGYTGISGCIKLSHLTRATEPLGITWKKDNGVLIPVSKGGIDLNDGGIEISHLLPSHSNKTDTGLKLCPQPITNLNLPFVITDVPKSTENRLSHFQGNSMTSHSKTPVDSFSQMLPPQKSDIMSHAAKDQLPLTKHNLLHQTTQSLQPLVAQQLPVQTTKNLQSRTAQNLLYQELQHQQSKVEGNSQTQTEVLYQREACSSNTGPCSPVSVCSDASVSRNMSVPDIHPYTNPTLTPDPPDKFYTCKPTIKHNLHNMVCPSRGHGQHVLKITETCFVPRYQPYPKSKEAIIPVHYQTSLPDTVKDLFMPPASTDT